jgi:Methyltransferase domain
MKEKWNERYSQVDFAYGETPNEFLRSSLKHIPVGKILFPAEGEGRNAVYATTLGWEVFAFDMSEEGKKKAQLLAEKHQVSIDYQVAELDQISYEQDQFDAIALIYAHFSAATKSDCHRVLQSYLKQGGLIIFEAFSKNHLPLRRNNPSVGGPEDLDMLFSIEEIKSDFDNFEIIQLSENVIELNEGLCHVGTGSVIRFVGRKK